MKSLFLFLLKFLLCAAIIAPMWYFVLGNYYNQLLTAVLDIGFPDAYQCHLQESKLLLVDHAAPKGPEVKVVLNILTLHFNVTPFLCLFIVTPGVNLRKRLIYLLIGFILLSSTHFIHARLDFYVELHQNVTITSNDINSYFNYKYKQFILFCQAFMEQAGSMLMPFFLWLLFFNKTVLRVAQRQVTAKIPQPNRKFSE